ncbi:hypothetical protein ANANG_G00211170 [Anguilla anguilla]|uniref:Uncharacterized protein n=1 Tax=Anguilla anguilla TaxID=7936 RepID=A0A9D3M121_ANGAN|nr:hypothetical protein ANANG_G00211170 [Anguilla anguilla]
MDGPAPLKKLKRKRRKVKNTTRHHRATPEESSTEESTGDRDTEEATPGRQVPQSSRPLFLFVFCGRVHMRRAVDARVDGGQTKRRESEKEQECQWCGADTAATLQEHGDTPSSTAAPKTHRSSGQWRGRGRGRRAEAKRKGARQPGSAQKGESTAISSLGPGAVVDSDQQRKTEAERQRNKKRLREKQRQAQRDSSPGHRHGHAGQGNQEGRRAKRRSRAGASQAESDLAAWRRVQAQISSLLDPELGDFNGHSRTMQGALAFPRSPAHFQGYSYPMPLEFVPPGPMMGRGYPFPSAGPPQPASSQLVNSFGAWAQPWQKAPIPNTRHNAEFLRSLQPPPIPARGRPVAVPGAPSPSASARRPATSAQPGLPELPAAAERADRRGPRAGGKRKAKGAVARDDGGRPRPQPPDGEEGSESA